MTHSPDFHAMAYSVLALPRRRLTWGDVNGILTMLSIDLSNPTAVALYDEALMEAIGYAATLPD